MDLYSCLHRDGKKKALSLEDVNEKCQSGEINSIDFDEKRVIKTLAFMTFAAVSSHFSSSSQLAA